MLWVLDFESDHVIENVLCALLTSQKANNTRYFLNLY